MNKLTYPIAIVIAAVILAGGFWIVQANKQASIERQVAQKGIAERAAASTRQMMIDACVSDAETAYWDYMKLNGTTNDDGSVTALTRFWDAAAKDKKDANDLCLKRY